MATASRQTYEAGTEVAQGNRRKHSRYRFVTDFSYCVSRDGSPAAGRGRTVDMSAVGVRVALDRRLPPGTRVEATLAWPGIFHGAEQVLLALTGRIIRSTDETAVLQILDSQFRVAGRPAAAGSDRA